MKTTLRDIKELVKYEKAVDVTNFNMDDYKTLKESEGYFTEIAHSIGTYGVTGRVVQGSYTGTLYAVTRRTSAIYLFG